jgi:IS1 family transposase
VVAWASGPREEALARQVVTTTRRRTKGQTGIPYVTDGWAPYAETIREIYRDRDVSKVNPRWAILKPTAGIALTQAVKHRKGRRLERIEVRTVIGERVYLPYSVHLDRLHGTLRDRLNCLTRKTHGFAKEVATWDALFSLALFEHNWLRSHLALRLPLAEPHQGRRYQRRSPAMSLALTEHVWSWEEFLRLPIQQRASTTQPECGTSA